MDATAQAQLIREFMLAVAPKVTAYSLEAGVGMTENAAVTLECSMQLAARYNQLYETLTAAPQNPVAANKPKTGEAAAPVRKTPARVPLKKSDVPDLSGPKEPPRASPLSPAWRPPDPYV